MSVKPFQQVQAERYTALSVQDGSMDVHTIRPNEQQPVRNAAPVELGKRSRLFTEEALTFWNCMVPYGWSLGGLVTLLLNRNRHRAEGDGSAFRPLVFGFLSTLCYLMAVLQAWRNVSDQNMPKGEAPAPLRIRDQRNDQAIPGAGLSNEKVR